MIEDDAYSSGRYVHRLSVFQQLMIECMFVTREISMIANGVGLRAGSQSWSEKRGRYYLDKSSTDWVIALDFFEGARRKRVRMNAGAGC
jgi:hypothetical protein